MAGLVIYLATCLLARQPLIWAWALLPGVVLAALFEGWEILDHYGAAGLLRTSARDLAIILARHSRDIAVANLGAGAVFLSALAWDRWIDR